MGASYVGLLTLLTAPGTPIFNDMAPKALDDFIYCKAGLWFDDGPMFGKGGEGFQRLNAACPRAALEMAMKRLENAVNAL